MLGVLCRPTLRCAAAAAGGAAALCLAARHGSAHALAASPADSALGSLWATALDGMIGVPASEHLSLDGVLYLAPAPADAPPPPRTDWPRLFAKGAVFSFTAHNPMGVDAPAEWNRKANEALEKDIREMHNAPRAWWHSFGFNAGEGWREDGFSLAFAREERVFARRNVLQLAHKYRQAAIYAYTVQDGQLVRETVWVDKAKQAAHGSQELMRVLDAPPDTALAAKGYQPPADDGTKEAPPPFAPDGRPSSIWSLRWN